MCSASQLAAKLLHHESSCASRLAARAQCLKSHETSYVFQLVARAKCHNKSNKFAFRLIVGFIQKFQSRLQQALVDLSLSNAFSIASHLMKQILLTESLRQVMHPTIDG
jgi:hypothetical protein